MLVKVQYMRTYTKAKDYLSTWRCTFCNKDSYTLYAYEINIWDRVDMCSDSCLNLWILQQ